AGTGSEAKARWDGRTTGGALAPPGWATMTVTATGGGATARPVVSRVFVDRTQAPAGSSTGGFAAGAWRGKNPKPEQPSTPAPVFASYRWAARATCRWWGTGTATAPRPSGSSGPTPPSTATISCSATAPAAARRNCASASAGPPTTGTWATGTATAPGLRACSGAAPAGT